MVTLEKNYTYEMIFDEMKHLAGIYGEILQCRIIGQSHDDRLIPMIELGKGKEVLFCTAGVHGREIVNPVILLKMIEEYARAYVDGVLIEGHYDINKILRRYSICFIPLVNPDGYEIATRGYGAIQNPRMRQEQRIRRIAAENWKYNARGVDINRNFPCKSYIQQQYYEYPGSENETLALMNLFREYKSVGYIDFHSRGKVIYYYRQAMPQQYNQRSYQLARHLQNLSHYSLGRKEEELLSNVSGGNSVHYYSETTGNPAITVETVEDEAGFPLDVRYQDEAYREVRCIPLGILECL